MSDGEFLTAEQILGADDLESMPLDVPVWGKVLIRKLDGQRLEELERLITAFNSGATAKQTVRAFAAVHSLCDPNRKLLFNAKQIDAVASKSGEALDAIFHAVLDFNGMTKKAAEALAKNS